MKSSETPNKLSVGRNAKENDDFVFDFFVFFLRVCVCVCVKMDI